MRAISIQSAMERFSLKLKSCPAPGEGVHKWIYYAACALVDRLIGTPARVAFERGRGDDRRSV